MTHSKNSPDSSRRGFLGVLAGSACAFAWLRSDPAHAQGAAPSGKHVTNSEPLAKALGYTDDATKVDKAKFPTFKAGDKCSTCRFFMGTAGQSSGPCQIFSNELVSSTGWCSSYNAKT
jgi:High potential iron-sulfur protein